MLGERIYWSTRIELLGDFFDLSFRCSAEKKYFTFERKKKELCNRLPRVSTSLRMRIEVLGDRRGAGWIKLCFKNYIENNFKCERMILVLYVLDFFNYIDTILRLGGSLEVSFVRIARFVWAFVQPVRRIFR